MIQIPAIISVKDLADKLNLPVTKVIGLLMKNGINATINESLDFETAAIIAEEFGQEAEKIITKSQLQITDSGATQQTRPPIVTIMGHVDHGKTTLLDAIRQTDVASGESGGITQHIGAYQIEHKNRLITFLDTPGHSAFSALRQHGANITDIVVLVIAANEGIKAQTVEAIDHARQAGASIIVAITKIDLPDANLDRIKQQLAELDLVPEEWGGKTIIAPVSAKQKTGLNELLEMILLVADLKDLKAFRQTKAAGVVIEAKIESGLGSVATVLIQNGELKIGDIIVAGTASGKIRTITNFKNQKIEQANPSDPVRIAGLKTTPNFGDPFLVVENDKEAKNQAEKFRHEQIETKVYSLSQSGLSEGVNEIAIEQKQLNLVIKTDVKGSSEAIQHVLSDLGNQEVSVKITLLEVGPVTDSDLAMAKATNSTIVAFRVPVNPALRSEAGKQKVVISRYDVIYDLVSDAREALSKLLPPEEVEIPLSRSKVLAVYKGDKRGKVIGVQIDDGLLSKGNLYRLRRGEKEIAAGSILNLRREKLEIESAKAGQQIGVLLINDANPMVDDVLETYKIELRKRSLS